MDKSLGNNIKTMRKQKGFTQEELASQLGVTSQAVSRWEAGSGMPDVSMIVPLAQILEVTTDAIFGLDKMHYDDTILENVKTRLKQIHKGQRKSQNALEDYRVHASFEEAVSFGIWGLKVLDTLSEDKESEECINTFRRRIYIYIIEACLRAQRTEEARIHLNEMLDKHITSPTDEDVIRLQQKIGE